MATRCGGQLHERDRRITLAAVQPDGLYHALEGVKHIASTVFVPGIYDATLADHIVEVSSEDALDTMHPLAGREGLLVGVSGRPQTWRPRSGWRVSCAKGWL